MKLVCVDTHILIWGIRERAEDGQEVMIHRTKAFIEWCKSNKTTIMVPSIVVGELLTAIEPMHHAMVVNLLESGFDLPSYDAKAAALFARLWREKHESGLVAKLQKEMQATRQELKADCMIVATAITRNAEVLYSHDAKLKKFANGNIAVKEIPELQYQEALKLEPVS
ncbi:type II toxin-antitoxin system VapC family toxin [Spongiibacter sp. UBA1325]|uniref:type II toxin-antitoxin system VapC family toxin n=1 Tax=Spongiibacter sp. UBA1325 TaxID=1947543 RepID=UPI002580ACEB|nr:PIN domain-containing protein [Spongiibacter sp. UBA1325]|tara:strand:+ start:1422 stop:1925 length:504 start_codon:yes stop_codon:yes gene_type:complete